MNEQNAGISEIPREARQWAMICHLIALVGLLGNGIGFFLGPLITWLIKKEDHPFIDEQGKEAVNFQITMLIVLLISVVLCLVFIGFLFLFVIGIVMVVFPIIAGIQANDGKHYRYPINIRFIK